MLAVILLLMVSCAWAQPVFGPYGVYESASRIGDLEACVRGDTLDAVWISDAQVVWQRFNLAAAAPLGDARIVDTLHNWPKLELHDLTARNDSSWCCVVYEDEAVGYGMPGANVSGFFCPDNYVWLDSSVSYYYIGKGPRSGFSVRGREGGHATVMWLGEHWDPHMYGITIFGATISADGEILNKWDVAESPLDRNRATRAVDWSSNDTFVRTLFPGVVNTGVISCYVTAESGECDYSGDLSNPIYTMIELERITGSLALALYSEDNSQDDPRVARVSRPDSTQFEFEYLGPVGLNYVTSSFFHRDFGFAVVEANPGYLLVARVDTTGQPVQPVGVLYETSGTSLIANADVTITDDGKVVCVWSEYDDESEGPRRLKTAWVAWDEFVDTPDQSAPAPQEFTLSAYPNPFNSSVTISFELPRSGDVELNIFDLNGRLVETLRDDFSTAGTHTLNWSPGDLASGVYFAQMEAMSAQRTRKMLFIK